MSIDRCFRCNAQVDTDFDLECYTDVSVCVCKNCREEFDADKNTEVKARGQFEGLRMKRTRVTEDLSIVFHASRPDDEYYAVMSNDGQVATFNSANEAFAFANETGFSVHPDVIIY